ncbi:MAG TPA: dihydroneopterin aldolase [Stellaceae bacterium]|nr:dihydroneopterin aldolase [Stellaceae bacterium]
MAWMLADALGIERRPAPRAAQVYRILVRDLVLPCRIGVYEHEKQAPQRVRINAQLLVERDAADGDALYNVLNYETIVEGIRALARGGHIELIETFAEQVMAVCLASPRALAARISVEKLDVFADAESVGVVLRRRRPRRPLAG